MALKAPLLAGLLVLLVVAQAPAPAAAGGVVLNIAGALVDSAAFLAGKLLGLNGNCETGIEANTQQFIGTLEVAGYGNTTTPSVGARSAARGRHHKCDWSPPDTNYKQLSFDFRIAGVAIVDELKPLIGTLASRFIAAAGGFLSGDVVFSTTAVDKIDNAGDLAELLNGVVDFVQDGAWAAGYAATPYTLDADKVSFKTAGSTGSPLGLTSFSISAFDRSLLSIGAVASIGGPVKGKYSLTKTKVDIDEGDDISGFDSSQCYVAYIQSIGSLPEIFITTFTTSLNGDCRFSTFPVLCAYQFAAGVSSQFLKCAVFYEGTLTYSKNNPYFENYFTATQSINTGNLGTFASKRNNLVCGNLQIVGGDSKFCSTNVPKLPTSKSGKGNKLL